MRKTIIATLALTTSLWAQGSSFRFVGAQFSDPNWVVATSDLLLTDGKCISNWYDNPEKPCQPSKIRYWKFAGGREEGSATPLSSLGAGAINGVYVRKGYDAYIYKGGNTDSPYSKKDAGSVDHPVILGGPYYFAPVGRKTDPKNPDRNNFAHRTFLTSGNAGSLGKDSLVIAPRRVIIIDIDGTRRDAIYDLLANHPQQIPALGSIFLGRNSTGKFQGNISSKAIFTGPDDLNNTGATDFSKGFQSAGVDKAVTALPSYTFVCQATLFTSSQPRNHGILGNEWFDRSGNFNSVNGFRRGYSGGSGYVFNQITRNYEWQSLAPDGPCTWNLINISNNSNAWGWGGLCSLDLKRDTIYDWFARSGIDSLISFQMYISRQNYHKQPLIDYVQPRDSDMCNYIEDDTGELYDKGMVDMTLKRLGQIRAAGKRFPRVLTIYFAGHDHKMHHLGNDQKGSLRWTDTQIKRFQDGIKGWVDPQNFLYALVTDHGHTKTLESRSIVTESDLEDIIENVSSKYDVYDFGQELDFNIYVAQNGGLAHVHVKRDGGSWKSFPKKANLLKIAQACYRRKSPGGTISIVLGRDSEAGKSWSTPYKAYDPAKHDFIELEAFLKKYPQPQWVDPVRRLREMNCIRSGDLILMPNWKLGYTIDSPVVSSHGGIWDSDSLIPMVFGGRPLQRMSDSERTIPFANQYDFGECVGGYLDAPISADGIDRLGPLLESSPASYSTFGAGCRGNKGIPLMRPAPGNLPWIGKAFTLDVTNVPASTPAAIFIGGSSMTWGSIKLPFDMSLFGMPGCHLRIRPDWSFPIVTPGGKGSFTLPIARNASVVGTRFYNQAFALDRSANALGGIVSNGGAGKIGAR